MAASHSYYSPPRRRPARRQSWRRSGRAGIILERPPVVVRLHLWWRCGTGFAQLRPWTGGRGGREAIGDGNRGGLVISAGICQEASAVTTDPPASSSMEGSTSTTARDPRQGEATSAAPALPSLSTSYDDVQAALIQLLSSFYLKSVGLIAGMSLMSACIMLSC
jgi:hypothetical protein